MGETLVLMAQTEILVMSSIMVFTALVIALVYALLKNRSFRFRTEAAEPYLSGEGEEVVSRVNAPSLGLYWGFIKGWGRRMYAFLKDEMHNGILSDWASYMALWLCSGLVLALAAVVAYVVWGG